MTTQLAAWRAYRSFSVSDLACESGVSERTILMIEHGHVGQPHPSTQLKLAKALGAKVEHLASPPPPPEAKSGCEPAKQAAQLRSLARCSTTLPRPPEYPERAENRVDDLIVASLIEQAGSAEKALKLIENLRNHLDALAEAILETSTTE